MIKSFKIIIVLSAVAVVAACSGEAGVYAHDQGYYYEETEYSYNNSHRDWQIGYYEEEHASSGTLYEIPELQDFYLVDSYGHSNEAAHNQALAISPYENNGLFEVYWYTLASADYWVEFYVNDAPDLTGSEYIASELCGMGLECEEDGIQFCQYTSDLYLSCDTGEQHDADVSQLIYTLPQTLYFIVQVCDFSYESCEYSYYPVLFE